MAADQEPQKTSIKFLRRQTGLKGKGIGHVSLQ